MSAIAWLTTCGQKLVIDNIDDLTSLGSDTASWA